MHIRFQMNGDMSGFHPQTLKLPLHRTTLISLPLHVTLSHLKRKCLRTLPRVNLTFLEVAKQKQKQKQIYINHGTKCKSALVSVSFE